MSSTAAAARSDESLWINNKRFDLIFLTLSGALVGGNIRRQELDSDLSAELLVLSQVDLAHAAAPELPDDQVVRDGLANHGLADR